MNRAQLITHIAEQIDSTQAHAERILKAFQAGITAGLCEHGEVRLLGFGRFALRERPARQIRHPQTGEALTIAASKIVQFRPGQKLRESL